MSDQLEAVLARLDREMAVVDEKVAVAHADDPDSQYAASRRGWRRGLMQARQIVATALETSTTDRPCPYCVDGRVLDGEGGWWDCPDCCEVACTPRTCRCSTDTAKDQPLPDAGGDV